MSGAQINLCSCNCIRTGSRSANTHSANCRGSIAPKTGLMRTVQRLVNAFYKTLKWLEKATPEQIAAAVPPEYHLGDPTLYKKAVQASRPMYSKDGIVSAAGMKNAYDMLVQFDEELKKAKVDLPKTFDDRFVKKAAGTM